ncbi:hypothetical protein OB69_04925 [Roseivirga seohaensis subsp. aquiponti]|uniref:Uncharacterized protein n=1 Tax=Roseivirga seohaensis subsp. aquiponti TaxID=1566026 RepID=A0A0L8AMT0_9BACT|nr:hypothetical protein OB69_04925 [Roseivirga seohaensis subsp. aquiponti]
MTVILSFQDSSSVCCSVFPKGETLRYDIMPFQGNGNEILTTRDIDGLIDDLKPQRGEIT